MSMPQDSKGRYQYSIKLERYEIPCKPGDSVFIYATAEDDYGFNYKCYLVSYMINENDGLDYDPHIIDHTKLVDIY